MTRNFNYLLMGSTHMVSDQSRYFMDECIQLLDSEKTSLVRKPALSEQRHCTDICCLIVFLGILIGFLFYSVFSITRMYQNDMTTLNPLDTETFMKQLTHQDFNKLTTTIASCIVGSIGFSLVVALFLKFIPHQTVIVCSFGTVIVMLVVAIYDFVETDTGFGAFFIVIGMVYFFFICSFWEQMDKASIMVAKIGNFIFENLQILSITVFSLLYSLVVIALWLFGIFSFFTRYSFADLSSQGFGLSLAFWIVTLVFFNFYFYYTSVYLTSSSVAIWFYGMEEIQDIVTGPFKQMARFHLGSITFASILIAISKPIKAFFWFAVFRDSSNPLCIIGTCTSFVIYFCCGCIQGTLEVVNNYAVTLCSLTGKDILSSAKIIGSFMFQDPQNLFGEFTTATNLLRTGSMLLISSVPTLIAAIVLGSLQSNQMWILGILTVFFCSSIVALLILQLYIQSLTTLFLIYMLDGKLTKEGLEIVWIDTQAEKISESFGQAFRGKVEKSNVKTVNRTTYIINPDGSHQVFQQKVQLEQTNDQINVTSHQA